MCSRNPETMQVPGLTCVLLVKTGLKGWQRILTKIFHNIEGLAFSIDLPNGLMYLWGEVDPVIFIKKLQRARTHSMLCRIDYGYEENPQETRKPNSHFTIGRFELNTLENTWYRKMKGALKTIQGISFTIDGPTQMGYLRGNIEAGVLMRMMKRTGIDFYAIDYGFKYSKDTNLKPLPWKLNEAPPANTNVTQPLKDKEIKEEVICPSTNIKQSKEKKKKAPQGFKKFLVPKFWFL